MDIQQLMSNVFNLDRPARQAMSTLLLRSLEEDAKETALNSLASQIRQDLKTKKSAKTADRIIVKADQVFDFLKSAGKPTRAPEIAAHFGVKTSIIANHLFYMKEKKLVRRVGRGCYVTVRR